MVEATSKMKEGGKFFGKMGNIGNTIQVDDSVGHCFVIKVLIPMDFFK